MADAAVTGENPEGFSPFVLLLCGLILKKFGHCPIIT